VQLAPSVSAVAALFIFFLFCHFLRFWGNSNFFNMLDVIIGRLEAVRERGARISATND
jgi:hypothetical protein